MPDSLIDPKSIAGKPLTVRERTALLIIGAGPAGLAAAIGAARRDLSVMLLDENPVSFAAMGEEIPLHFGQGMSGAARNRNAMMEAFVGSEPLIAEAFEAGVDIRLGVSCFGLYGNGPGVGWLPGLVAGVADENAAWFIGAEHVVVAAGRRDIGIAFPGWERPGVMGATAAALLAKRFDALRPRRAVILGSTTEALSTALTLRAAGVEIAAVIEQADTPVGPAHLGCELRAAGVEMLTRHVIRDVTGRDGVESVLVRPIASDGRDHGPERRIACDGVVLAVGATPVIDLLDAIGCRVAFQPERGGYAPVLDADQRTSIANVFAVGDCAGIWPSKSLDRSVAEAEARRAVAAIQRDRGEVAGEEPAPAPDTPAFDLSAYRLAWVRASVVQAPRDCHVCQCEKVTAREILEVRPPRYLRAPQDHRNDRSLASLIGDGPPSPDQIKRLTRAGMGPCQGRRCREQVAALLALGANMPLPSVPLAGYRAPVRPLPLALAGGLLEPPAQAEHWDSWFGMHAQWRPFWEVPEHYTVAGNDISRPMVSE